ncbi:PREDICTED: granzyme B [Condylura cristata]|uniref:granzyme B n=1 Tax=Condylura cristata TaxID=143302 RepID=UPI0006438257|nr:PREDICTED: granzyme B [Condylura cristata]
MQPLPLLVICLLFPELDAVQIIDGNESKPHSRPYMAFLRMQYPNKKCGGFLIREDFVLTAVHCWENYITITLGAHDITKTEPTQQVIPAIKAIPHPDYNPGTSANDIMLLQGDSGGPLVCDEVAEGIVSSGHTDGKPPRVFTRISSFVPWIEETMSQFKLQGPGGSARD